MTLKEESVLSKMAKTYLGLVIALFSGIFWLIVTITKYGDKLDNISAKQDKMEQHQSFQDNKQDQLIRRVDTIVQHQVDERSARISADNNNRMLTISRKLSTLEKQLGKDIKLKNWYNEVKKQGANGPVTLVPAGN